VSQQRWEASQRFLCDWHHWKLAYLRTMPHLWLLFPNRGPTTRVGFFSSSFPRLLRDQSLFFFSRSFESRKVYRICIQLVVLIVKLPHKTLLHLLPVSWVSFCVNFVPYVNCAFPLDTDPARSWRSTSAIAMTNEWDMTAEHGLSYVYDELLKRSVDESRH